MLQLVVIFKKPKIKKYISIILQPDILLPCWSLMPKWNHYSQRSTNSRPWVGLQSYMVFLEYFKALLSSKKKPQFAFHIPQGPRRKCKPINLQQIMQKLIQARTEQLFLYKCRPLHFAR